MALKEGSSKGKKSATPAKKSPAKKTAEKKAAAPAKTSTPSDKVLTAVHKNILIQTFKNKNHLLAHLQGQFPGDEIEVFPGEASRQVAFEINGKRIPAEGYYSVKRGG